MKRYEVKFTGGFYFYALLNEKGESMPNLTEAAALAEDMYGNGSHPWHCVSDDNGKTFLTRHEYLVALSNALLAEAGQH